MSKYLFLFIMVAIFSDCKESQPLEENNTSKVETTHPGFIRDLEAAHNKANFIQNEVVCFNLDLTFRDKKAFEGKIYSTTNSSFIRIENSNGRTYIFKDGKYFSNSDSTEVESTRFSIHTWQYFFMLPFKLSDPGTKWELLSDKIVNGEPYKRCKLTFEKGTGDAPDDWYVIHYHPIDHLIHHVGYIVTAGNKSVEEAEKNARSISYSDYVQVDSVQVAQTWTFSNYDMDSKITDTLGFAKVANILFLDNVDIFNISEDPNFKQI